MIKKLISMMLSAALVLTSADITAFAAEQGAEAAARTQETEETRETEAAKQTEEALETEDVNESGGDKQQQESASVSSTTEIESETETEKTTEENAEKIPEKSTEAPVQEEQTTESTQAVERKITETAMEDGQAQETTAEDETEAEEGAYELLAEKDSSGLYEYICNAAGEATITKYIGAKPNPDDSTNSTDLTKATISDSLDNHIVVGIGSGAFKNCSWLKEITINASIRSIGSNAFRGCIELEKINVPASLIEIRSDAFNGCEKLGSIEITANNVETIGSNAFYGCKKLTSIGAANSNKLKSIGSNAFHGCAGLESITIPDSVTTIGDWAFSECEKLKTVTLPNKITEISSYAFNGCTALETVTIPDTVTEIGSSAFSDCISLTNLPITDTHKIETIGSNAFSGCIGLTNITIPDSVTEIRSYAFEGCKNLSTVNLGKIKTLGYNGTGAVFLGCESLAEITIPKSLTTVYGSSFKGCTKLTKIPKTSFEEGTERIAANLFDSCETLEEIEIPETVKEIGSNAFSGCKSLKSVNLSGIQALGGSAFSDCESLAEITIPKSLTTMNGSDFKGCRELKTIKFEEGIEQIAPNLFDSCEWLISIEIPDTVKEIGSNAFNGCKNLTTVALPDKITEISSYAFNGCAGLQTIDIPKSVTTIGSNAFSNCTGLTDIPITNENNVTTIGSYAFSGCTGLTNITIPDTVAEIRSYAFEKCTNLETVNLGKIKTLGYNGIGSVFSGCDSLTTITIPKSLTTAHGSVFKGCTKLTTITKETFEEGTEKIAANLFDSCESLISIEIPDTVTAIGNNAFHKCSNLQSITIPDSVTMIGSYAFSGCKKLSTVALSKKIEEISSYAFDGCAALQTIELPESVQIISSYAFQNAGLTALNLPKNITKIEYSAFRDNTALSEVTLNNGLKTIGSYAFYNDDALEQITVPDSVTSIGQYVFAGSDTLQNVNLGTGLTVIPKYAFERCPALQEIILPYRITTVEDYAFANCTGLIKITIPGGTSSISDNAFSYPRQITVRGIAGTYVHTYADAKSMKFESITQPAEKAELNPTELTLTRGKTSSLILSVTPADFTDSVIWKSGDETIASVDDKGIVTARSGGKTTIIVGVGTKTLTCAVTVVQPVTGISLNKTSLSLDQTDEYTLSAVVSPGSANNKLIKWTSDKPEVAAVSETGVVKAVAEGTANIKAASEDNDGVYKICKVTVHQVLTCSNYSELQSAHNYADNTSRIWKYTSSGAESLDVTFDEQTYINEFGDVIYICDGKNNEIEVSDGGKLAGKTINVPGDTVKIKLVSNGDGRTAWGFAVSQVKINVTGNRTVTYNMQGHGTQVPTAAVQNGTKVTKPANPEAEGYTFGGWYEDSGCTKAWDFDNSTVTADIILYAKWTENKPVTSTFTIMYDMQGHGTQVPAAAVQNGEKVTKPANPEAEGYTFGGWYEDKECTKAWDFENGTVTADKTLYAKWTENKPESPGDDEDDSPYHKDDRIDLSTAANGVIANIKAKTFDGNPYIPSVKVTVKEGGKKKTLTEGIEYRVLYRNNINAGTGTVIVRGNGIYKGEITKDFVIKPKSIKKLKIVTGSMTVGDASVPPVWVYDGTRLLEKDIEYRLDYGSNLTAKKTKAAKVTVTAVQGSNYTGSTTAKLAVYEGEASNIINPVNVELQYTETTYTGKAIKDNKPTVKIGSRILEKNKDYKVQYQNSTNAGTAFVIVTGKGAYKGKVVKEFVIKPVTGVQLSGKSISDKTYNGKLQKPAVTGVKAGNKKLVKNRDYTVSYSNNLHAGTGRATITGKGNYAGQTLTLSFAIKPQKISKAVVKGTRAKLTLTYSGKILKEDTHYETPSFDEASIKKNKIQVTITGKGDFTGSVTKKVKVQ